MWLYRILTTQLMCGCWIGTPVETANTVSRPVRHSLPQELENLYGSDINGSCTSVVSGANSDICSGTSVLNDGIIPALSGVGDSTSQWAAQLFTMRRFGTDNIVVSFEVTPVAYDRIELTVFNCPERGIYAPSVKVYVDVVSFLPERSGNSLGFQITESDVTLSGTSCDYLLKFCVELSGAVTVRYFNLEFPYRNNSDFVFLGEVTFLNVVDPDERCGPPELITSAVTLSPLPTESTTSDINDPLTISVEINNTTAMISELDNSTSLTTTSKLDSVGGTFSDSQCTTSVLTTGVVSAIVTGLLVAAISMAIHVAVYQCVYKPKLRSATGVIPGANSSSDASRHGDAIVYDVVNERVETSLEMKQNEAYGLTRSR